MLRSRVFAFAMFAPVVLGWGCATASAFGADLSHAPDAPDSTGGGGVPRTTQLAQLAAEVPMDLRYGKPIVEAFVNGKGPYRFFLDSGAGGTVLDSAFAAELGLAPHGKVALGDPSNPGAIRATAVTIDSLALGGAVFGDFEAVCFDRSGLYKQPDAPRGVLGFPLFRDLLLTFDFPKSRVRLERGALSRLGGAELASYTTPAGVPEIAIDVADHRMRAHLDSGSPGALILPASFRDSIPLTGPLREVGRGRTVTGEHVFMGGNLAQPFRLGGHEFDTLLVRFAERFPIANVGNGVLRQFAVTFDQKRQRVRFAFDPSAGSAPAAGYGVRMRPLPDGTLEVVELDPGSPAEKAGVELGDVVLGIDGRSVVGMSDAERAAQMKKPRIMLNVRRGAHRYGYGMHLD